MVEIDKNKLAKLFAATLTLTLSDDIYVYARCRHGSHGGKGHPGGRHRRCSGGCPPSGNRSRSRNKKHCRSN